MSQDWYPGWLSFETPPPAGPAPARPKPPSLRWRPLRDGRALSTRASAIWILIDVVLLFADGACYVFGWPLWTRILGFSLIVACLLGLLLHAYVIARWQARRRADRPSA